MLINHKNSGININETLYAFKGEGFSVRLVHVQCFFFRIVKFEKVFYRKGPRELRVI